jgi:hypothetical protein
MISELLLDFSETNNLKTLRVNDSSFYNPKITPECGLLEVTPPGYINSINFNVDAHFSIVLNSSNLKLAKVNVYRNLGPLPDGVYTFRYSIKPNEDLWVEYDYLRVTDILKKYYQELCALKAQPYPQSKDFRERLSDLREIKGYIDIAQAEVNECGNRKKGMELYKYAQELLSVGCKSC